MMKPQHFFAVLLLLLMFGGRLSAQETSVAIASAETMNVSEQVEGGESEGGLLKSTVQKVLHWYDQHMNYFAVTALMAVESSFVPFPSEVIIPPAVFIAANPDSASGMKIWMIVLFGTLGAMIGAFVNYYISKWLGRPIIYKFADSRLGHLFLLSGEKVQKAEKYFNDHGIVSTLIGRLVPVVRQLISIPAGLAKMNVASFAIFTCLGALIWNTILAVIGFLAYKAGELAKIAQMNNTLSHVLIVAAVLLVAVVILRAVIKKKKAAKAEE